MEDFKVLDQLTQADSRWTGRMILNHQSGAVRPYTIEEHYRSIRIVEVTDRAPEHVREHFQTAQHLMLYSWYVYPFGVVGEMHAYASLEYALRLRLGYDGDRPPGLRSLLNEAVAKGLLTDQGFVSYSEDGNWPVVTGNSLMDANLALNAPGGLGRSRVEALADIIPKLRNDFAHGSMNLWPPNIMVLRVVAEAINQLYSAPGAG